MPFRVLALILAPLDFVDAYLSAQDILKFQYVRASVDQINSPKLVATAFVSRSSPRDGLRAVAP